MKKTFYSEAAYVVGILLLALGAALMTKSDFGVSMVIAPAYVLHLEIAKYLPWFTFGMSVYTVQIFIIFLMSLILRKLKINYFYSIITAVVYGHTLDLFIYLLSFLPSELIALRIVYFAFGMLFCSIGVAFIFNTYLPPEAYELLVKNIAKKYSFDIGKTKTVYDCTSALVAIILSFVFFGLWQFEGVKLGTVVCALLNGFIIGCFSKWFDRVFDFKDRFPLRKYFS